MNFIYNILNKIILSKSLRLFLVIFIFIITQDLVFTYFQELFYRTKILEYFFVELETILQADKSFSLDRAVAIFGALFLPPFIQIYGLARSENYLMKEMIRVKYSYHFVSKVVFCFILYSVSNNYAFKLTVNIFLAIELIFLYKDYYQINFESKRPALEMLASVFEKYTDNFKRYFEIKNLFISEVNSSNSLSENDINQSRYSLKFDSNLGVNSLDIKKLKSFLSELNDIATRSLSTRVYNESHEQISDLSKNSLFLKADYNIPIKRLILIVYLMRDIRHEDFLSCKNRLSEEFKKIFKYKQIDYEVEENVLNYFSQFSDHIYDLLVKKQTRECREEIKYMQEFLSKPENLSKSDNNILISLLRSLFNFTNPEYKEVLTPSIMQEIYEIALSLHVISLYSESDGFSEQASSLVIELSIAFNLDNKKFDRSITNQLLLSKPNQKSLKGYLFKLGALCFSSEDKRKDLSLRAFLFLLEDIRKNKFEVFNTSFHKVAVSLANSTLIQLSVNANKTGDRSKEKLYAKIDSKSFISDFFVAYNRIFGRAHFYESIDNKFDRFGFGSVITSSPYDEYESLFHGYLHYADEKNLRIEIPESFIVTQEMSSLMNNVVKRLEKESDNRSSLEKILKETKITFNESIINAKLDRVRIKKFVNSCENQYNETFKISDILKKKIETKDKIVNTLGLNLTISREFYTVEYGTELGGEGQNGKAIANGENNFLLKKIMNNIETIHNSDEEFFNKTLPAAILNKNSIVISTFSNWRFKFFDWSGNNKYNSSLKLLNGSDLIVFQSKEKQVHTIWARDMVEKEGFLILENNNKFNVNFYKNNITEDTDLTYNDHPTLTTIIEDLSCNKNRREDIISSEYDFGGLNSDDDKNKYLMSKLQIEQFVAPELSVFDDVEFGDQTGYYLIAKKNSNND